MRIFRRARREHDFRLSERIQEPDVPDQWHRVRAVCADCDEERAVYWAVSLAQLNMGPCVPAARDQRC